MSIPNMVLPVILDENLRLQIGDLTEELKTMNSHLKRIADFCEEERKRTDEFHKHMDSRGALPDLPAPPPCTVCGSTCHVADQYHTEAIKEREAREREENAKRQATTENR